MAAKQKTNEFYNSIRNEYDRLLKITEFGVQKYHDNWIKAKLADTFFREIKTIEDIIFYRV
jgi:uncharacterized metal-binding protein